MNEVERQWPLFLFGSFQSLSRYGFVQFNCLYDSVYIKLIGGEPDRCYTLMCSTRIEDACESSWSVRIATMVRPY